MIVEKPIPTQVATWYGGRTLSGCTTGFSVKNRTTGTRYVTTAGHCGSTSISPLTTAVNFYVPNNGFDFQTLYVPTGDSATNFVADNTYPYYHSITSVRVATMTVGTYVCKYGKTTGYGCGTIGAINISIGGSPAVYFRVDRSGTSDFVCGGDSGGPVYASSVAYGLIHAATNASCTGSSVDAYVLNVSQIGAKNYDVLVQP